MYMPSRLHLYAGYKIELSPEEEAYPQHLQQQHAISYVTNIRNRFADEPETYKYVKFDLGPAKLLTFTTQIIFENLAHIST